jgi:SM-20-related protein
MNLRSSEVESLSRRGFTTLKDYVSLDLAQRLSLLAQKEDELGHFTPSHVGNGSVRRHDPRVRGDRIRWWTSQLDEHHAARLELHERLESLRQSLNRELFVALTDYELHDAIFEGGAHYEAHLDTFRSDDRRRFSLVIYLQREWKHSDGGLLQLTDLCGERHELLPVISNSVIFLSDQIEHSVSAANCRRQSLACWFRIRPLP